MQKNETGASSIFAR